MLWPLSTPPRHARLYETLTGEPADPAAQLKAAIATAAIKHAKRVNTRAELKALTHAELAGIAR